MRVSNLSRIITCCFLAVSFTGCSETALESSFATNGRSDVTRSSQSGFDRNYLPQQSGSRARDPHGPVDAQFYPGNSQIVGNNRPVQYEIADNEKVHLNLVDVDIDSAAKAVVGEIMQMNYIIDPSVTGKITLQTTNSIKKSALLDAFDTLLAYNAASLVIRDDIVHIVPLSDPGSLPVSKQFAHGKINQTIGRSVKIVPLDYVAADEMIRLLEPILGKNAVLTADSSRNILFLSGNPREIASALDAINLFDIDQMRGKSFALLPVKNAEPDDLVDELETIFSNQNGEAAKGLVTFVPNARLSSILVISPRQHFLKQAAQWVGRLDRIAGGTKRKLFVYPIQNREATDLASLLENILSNEQQSNGNVTDSGAPIIQITAASSSDAEASGIGGGGSQVPNKVFNSGGVRIVADEANNAVLIHATHDEYQSILPMLRRLDSLPNQVLLEATIAEVTLTDELQFGLRWFFEVGNFDLKLSDALAGTVAPSSPGFSLLFSAGQSKVALSALSSITDVNVISSPNLMVLDNREAVLQIGDQVPIATQSAVDSADATIVNSIELRDTGIILTVTPRVNDSGRVILDIDQEVSDVIKTTTSGIDSPTIRQRKISTTVVVNDGDSLALGGLIQQKADITKSQVPVLGDVPVVGNLFRHKQDTEKRTELLILITPHVIRDLREANDVTNEFRKQLGGLRALGQGEIRSTKHKIGRLLN